jgi:apolipoprotein N-acyltransferase
LRTIASTDRQGDAARSIVDHNATLSDLAAIQVPPPALIVWPETSYPADWTEPAPGVAVKDLPRKEQEYIDDSKDLARRVAKRWQTNVLLGLNVEVVGANDWRRRYNSALLVRSDGQAGGHYDKMHRVPFGEYVPLVDWFPWMKNYAPYDHDYSVAIGENFARFPLGAYRFGVVICYEDTDPSLARQYVGGDGGPPVDFLVNISNDGWFDGTEEHEQHLAICRFRAIECRRAVVRAVNMGVSAVVDSNGRVLQPQRIAESGRTKLPFAEWAVQDKHYLPASDWGRFKKVAGVLTVTVPIDSRSSFYALHGDWLPWLCWLIIGLGLIRAVVRPALG